MVYGFLEDLLWTLEEAPAGWRLRLRTWTRTFVFTPMSTSCTSPIKSKKLATTSDWWALFTIGDEYGTASSHYIWCFLVPSDLTTNDWTDLIPPQMCFNAAKSWQLGWHAYRSVEINLKEQDDPNPECVCWPQYCSMQWACLVEG